MSKRRVSKKGVAFVASYEGFPNGGRPYNDPSGYATVGYGHLLRYSGVRDSDRKSRWVEGQEKRGILTHKEGRKLLRQDLNRVYAPPVRDLFRKGGPLRGKFKQHRFDALVSFAYNLGVGSISGARGFETINAAIDRGGFRRIGDAMLLYDWSAGRKLAGLTRRRNDERKLLLYKRYHP